MALQREPGTERRRGRRSLKIIVADDDRDLVDTLATVLRSEGHDVHAVYAGKDVLPTARFVRPDAIIVDIAVPGMSGYGKEHADRQVAQQVGFDHYLVKPCHPDEIVALLEPLRSA
jgi:DNA-binding response OmpR family regulator